VCLGLFRGDSVYLADFRCCVGRWLHLADFYLADDKRAKPLNAFDWVIIRSDESKKLKFHEHLITDAIV